MLHYYFMNPYKYSTKMEKLQHIVVCRFFYILNIWVFITKGCYYSKYSWNLLLEFHSKLRNTCVYAIQMFPLYLQFSWRIFYLSPSQNEKPYHLFYCSSNILPFLECTIFHIYLFFHKSGRHFVAFIPSTN